LLADIKIFNEKKTAGELPLNHVRSSGQQNSVFLVRTAHHATSGGLVKNGRIINKNPQPFCQNGQTGIRDKPELWFSRTFVMAGVI